MPTILYADDDLEQLEFMRLMLASRGFKFLEATDGRQAIEKIRLLTPDVILLDLLMPNVGGFGVLKAIKADAQTRHIPVIVLSAWPTGDNRERARQAGAVAFVPKPYRPTQLLQLINKALQLANSVVINQ